jgi:hypothetical protein
MKHWPFALLAIGALASAPAFGHEREHKHHRGDHGDYRSSTIEMLKHRDNALQREATVFRIGTVAQEQIADQRERIDDLIDRLEAGRDVGRHEVDQALGYPYHSHHSYHHGHHGPYGYEERDRG